MPEVARDVGFGPFLPRASFPEAFVKSYAAIAVYEPVDWDGERIYFLGGQMPCKSATNDMAG
jgi:hypothetical protein